MTIITIRLTEVPMRTTYQWIVRVLRSFFCIIKNGGHEMYVVRHEGGRLHQRCLLCKCETTGWEIGK